MQTIKQLTKQEAIDFANKDEWRSWSDKKIVQFQLYQKLLCIEWSTVHRAIENVFNRPVFTHEFADQEKLKQEYERIKNKHNNDICSNCGQRLETYIGNFKMCRKCKK